MVKKSLSSIFSPAKKWLKIRYGTLSDKNANVVSGDNNLMADLFFVIKYPIPVLVPWCSKLQQSHCLGLLCTMWLAKTNGQRIATASSSIHSFCLCANGYSSTSSFQNGKLRQSYGHFLELMLFLKQVRGSYIDA